MPERIQQIINRIVEWWKKFTTKQKMLIVSMTAVVIVALIILAYVVTRPTMVTLTVCESAEQATTVKDLLEGESIVYETSDDGLTYYVNQDVYGEASILLGTNDIPSDGYSIDDAIDGSFSTTEADKEKRYQLYLEQKFADQLATISNVSSAEVTLSLPTDDGTIIAEDDDAYANVILNLSGDMDADQAAGIAQYIATGLGNDDSNNILILDGDGNVLFSGADDASAAGTASSNQTARNKAESSVASEVKSVVLGTNVYDNVEVGMNLVMNFDKQNTVDYHYYVDEGQDQGYLDSRTESTTESTEGVAGTPGTDSNDNDTTYVTEDGSNSSSNTSDVTEDYLPSETITTTDSEVGSIVYDESSISVVATTYVMYDEDELEANGTLDGTTFDEFKAANSERVKTDVDQDFYTMVSNATGIAEENISITAYEVPMFQYSAGSGRDLTDYLQIALAVLIFAMLAFVVFRSLRSNEEAEEVEQELSVEALLESTQEDDLEDIGFSEKSEARILIEKFVDEKPDAVAALLRNWLNDDWS